jgi:hypothetical protein
MDWTSVEVQDLSTFGPVVYDFAIRSDGSPLAVIDSAEFWKAENSQRLGPHLVIGSSLRRLPINLAAALQRVAARAAQDFQDAPFQVAFKSLSVASVLSNGVWVSDHHDDQRHNIIYITQQSREP